MLRRLPRPSNRQEHVPGGVPPPSEQLQHLDDQGRILLEMARAAIEQARTIDSAAFLNACRQRSGQ